MYPNILGLVSIMVLIFLLLHDIEILSIFLKKSLNLDVVTHACNFNVWETEAGKL